MEPILEINNLSKMYKNNRGVKRISFSINKGDVVGLLGPNGSGKTTTMKAILGLVRPDYGSVRIFGMDVEDHFEEIMARTGALVEAPAIYTDLSAAANLRMMARLHPNVTEHRIDHVLQLVHMEKYKNDKAGRFSLGMKQRLGLALAWLSEPELVILDEPTNGLDIEGMIEVREIIAKMAEEKGSTFLISSHLAGEIEKTCNKVGVMHEGELIDFTTKEEALRLHPSMEDYFLSVVKDQRGDIVL